MTSITALSPNEPDIMPDYVDGKSRPAPAPAAKPLPPPVAPPPEPLAASSHREGESIPNVPDIPPAVISEAEAKALEAAAAAPEPELPEDSAPASPWWKWQLSALALLVGLFGALVFSQAISALALAATLPEWARYALLIPFGLCCLAVLWVCAGLFRSWFRLRAVRQVDLAALEELRLRAQTRQSGVEQYRAARTRVEDYLKRYPLSAEALPRLTGAGVSQAQTDALASARDFLVGRELDSRSWLMEFRDQYQSVLDSVAAARTRSWSLKAAGCVIASPLPLLDAVLVLGIALKLIKDLSVIYNVRTGRAGTVLILGRAVAAAFIAGVAEEATEAAGNIAADHAADLVGASLAAKMTGVIAPKLGEGVINALFIRHVGRAATRLLQPAKPAHKGKRKE